MSVADNSYPPWLGHNTSVVVVVACRSKKGIELCCGVNRVVLLAQRYRCYHANVVFWKPVLTYARDRFFRDTFLRIAQCTIVHTALLLISYSLFLVCEERVMPRMKTVGP